MDSLNSTAFSGGDMEEEDGKKNDNLLDSMVKKTTSAPGKARARFVAAKQNNADNKYIKESDYYSTDFDDYMKARRSDARNESLQFARDNQRFNGVKKDNISSLSSFGGFLSDETYYNQNKKDVYKSDVAPLKYSKAIQDNLKDNKILYNKNIQRSLTRNANPLASITTSYLKSLKAIKGVDNNFTNDGLYFHINGDPRPLSKNSARSVIKGLHALIHVASDPLEVAKLKYHIISTKLLLAYNNATRYVKSLYKLTGDINSNKASTMRSIFNLSKRTAAGLLLRAPLILKTTTIDFADKNETDFAEVGVAPQNGDLDITSRYNAEKQQIKNVNSFRRYGISAEDKQERDRDNAKDNNTAYKKAILKHISKADESWKDVVVDGTQLVPKWT